MSIEKPQEPSSSEKAKINVSRTASDAELILGGATYKDSESGPRLEVTKEQISDAKKEMRADLKEQAKSEKSGISQKETLSVENQMGYDRLNSGGKTLMEAIYEKAANRKTEGWLGSRIAAWGSKHLIEKYEGRRAKFSESKKESEQKHQEAVKLMEVQAKEIVDLEKTMTGMGIPLSEETKEKFAEQRRVYLEKEMSAKEKVEFFDGRIRSFEDAKKVYEEKKESAVDKICGRWEDKIKGNNNEIAQKADLLKDIKAELKTSRQEKTKLESDIQKLQKKAEGYKDPETKKALEEIVKQQQDLLKKAEKDFEDKEEKVAKQEKRIDKIKADNEGFKKKISTEKEKYSGKKPKREKKEELPKKKEQPAVSSTKEVGYRAENEESLKYYSELWLANSKSKVKIDIADPYEAVTKVKAVDFFKNQLTDILKKENDQRKQELIEQDIRNLENII